MSKPLANKVLDWAILLWLVCFAFGQWVFVYYLFVHYGAATLAGDYPAWQEGTNTGYRAGDLAGNSLFVAHILMAIVVSAGGILQLWPRVRARVPALHRWNGRMFLVSVLLLAIGGFYLTWVRGAVATDIRQISVSLNGVLLVWFAVLAWRAARNRDFVTHRRWALRMLLAANGVWFFRVGLVAWIVLNGGQPVGHTEDFDGLFDRLWGFGSFLVPLVILELLFRTQESNDLRTKRAFAIFLFAMTLIMLAGIVGAALFVWVPYGAPRIAA